jgi:hypothetical protein
MLLDSKGELVQPIDFNKRPGFRDDEYARVDHVHDLSSELYAKLARDSDGNMIDNSEFLISQRNFLAGTNIFPVDRWFLGSVGAVNASMTSTTTNIPPVAGISHGTRIVITTADPTMGAADYLVLQQVVEGYNFAEAKFGTIQAQDIILSFWARASVAGIYTCSFRNDPVTRSYVSEFVLEANVWKLVIISVPGCRDGTWNSTNGRGVYFSINLAMGSNFHGTPNQWVSGNIAATTNQSNLSATLSNTFDVTGVKLEVNNYSPYAKRRISDDLLNCKRYLQAFRDPPMRGVVNSTNSIARCGFVFPIEFRATPVLSSVTGSAFLYDGTVAGTIAVIVASYFDTTRVEHDFSMAVSGFTTGRAGCMYWNGGSSTWFYSAEI